MSNIYVYKKGPIDDWSGWLTYDEYIKIAKSRMSDLNEAALAAKISSLRKDAERLAKEIGWEGDFSMGPFYSAIPGTDGNPDSCLLIAWKQPNDGTTFVASPFRLTWLDGYSPMIAG